uniref:Uncharacterized protein n=1 Tax=Ditylum brightwellii TaxID=49249 RepID=A0A7S2EKI7_9STRA
MKTMDAVDSALRRQQRKGKIATREKTAHKSTTARKERWDSLNLDQREEDNDSCWSANSSDESDEEEAIDKLSIVNEPLGSRSTSHYRFVPLISVAFAVIFVVAMVIFGEDLSSGGVLKGTNKGKGISSGEWMRRVGKKGNDEFLGKVSKESQDGDFHDKGEFLRENKEMEVDEFYEDFEETFFTNGGPLGDDFGNVNDPGEYDLNRPFMFTFFEKVEKHTGMSDLGNEMLLEAWVDAWSGAGWNPVILSTEDARKHPDYDELMQVLEDFKFDDYNKMCFIRWIAMAAVGGGWMCDYDVFPLNPFDAEGFDLPNYGRLTVHQGIVQRSATPSLVSGSGEEFTRMAYLLIQNYIEHLDADLWTDMFALQDLGKQTIYDEGGNPRHYFEIMISVIDVEKVLQGEESRVEACKETWNKRAIHFSHHGLRSGVLLPGETVDQRAEIAIRWTEWWKENCEITEPYEVGIGT